MPLFDLKLTFAENGVNFTRNLLAFILIFSGATNVINVDMGSGFPLQLQGTGLEQL